MIERLRTILAGGAEVLFLQGCCYGAILLAVLLLNPWTALLGVIAVLAAYAFAWLVGWESRFLQAGYYVYNPLLVGMLLGFRFAPSLLVCLMAILAGIFTLLLTVPLAKLLAARWRLPLLSLPFSLAGAAVCLATAHLAQLKAAPPLPALLTSDLGLPLWLAGFFNAFGSLLFAPGALVGLLVSLLVLRHSRILFLLAVMGYGVGALVKGLTTGSISAALADGNSFNYVLVAMALGSTFVVPSLRSTLLAAIGVAATPFILAASAALEQRTGVPPMTLPFCLIALGGILLLRVAKYSLLASGAAGTPEEVRENWLVERRRYPGSWRTLALPFSGRWTVWQGFNGRWTHRGPWRHAYDFVIADEQGKTYRGDGSRLHDYYCYRMPVLAPVRGRVVKVVNDVEENLAGNVNGERNWGNLVLLEDPRGFCVELSHFAHRTIRVEEGQWVERGTVLGLCGNSGYSAQPHLHVQAQVDAREGAPTLPFSFVAYRIGDTYHANDLPRENAEVEPLAVDPQLDAATTFLPDSVHEFEVFGVRQFIAAFGHFAALKGGQRPQSGDKSPHSKISFRVGIAADGTHYFQSERGRLYFGKYDGTFYCFRLDGDDPWLRLTMMALPRMPLCYKHRLAWHDSIPLGMAVGGVRRLLARLGNLVWPRLAYVEIEQKFTDRRVVESVLRHPLLRTPHAPRGEYTTRSVVSTARVEFDVRGGFASIQVGDIQLIRTTAPHDAAASLPQPSPKRKRRQLMTATAILCLATMTAAVGGSGATHDIYLPLNGRLAAAVVGSDGAGGESASPIREALKQSRQAERSGDLAKAIDALTEQSKSHSGNYVLNLRLGWLNYMSGKQDEAERCYKAAVEAEAGSIEARLGYTLPLLAAAKYREAEAVAREIVTADPGNYYGNLRLAVALRLQQKTAAAQEVVQGMLSAYPTDTGFLAESATLSGAQSSAATSDVKILAAIGESSQAEGKGDYKAAIGALDKQLHAHTKDYLLNLRLGWLYYLNRDYAKSVQYYQMAVTAAPRSIEAKLGLLLPLLAQENYRQVELRAEGLLQHDRRNYYGSLRLAVALRLQKKYAAADKIVQHMLTAYPADVYWLSESGLLNLAEENKSAAKEAFADVLSLDPDNAMAKDALEKM